MNLYQETFRKVATFLEMQKKALMKLDALEGYALREQNGFDWSAKPNDMDFKNIGENPFEKWGRRIGLREALYTTTRDWILRNLMPKGELDKLGDMATLSSYGGLLSEDAVLSTDAPTFTTALMPAVRRIYHKLIALDLATVQPLSGPTGYIWWIDKRFGTTGGGGVAGQRLDQRRRPAYAASSEAGTIRDIKIDISRKTINTINYKLKFTWTIESEQDFRSQWKTDVEGELTPELLDEVAREIDNLLINDLFAGVGYNVNWSRAYPATDTTTPDKNAYDKTVMKAITQAAGYIAKKKGMLPNYLLMGPDIFMFLAQMNNFDLDPSLNATGLADMTQLDRRYVGTLNKMYAVYVCLDPNICPTDKILLGIRGATWKYATAYLATYIPLFMSAKYIIQDDFTQFAKGCMTRFAHGVIPEVSGGTTNKGLATVTLTAS